MGIHIFKAAVDWTGRSAQQDETLRVSSIHCYSYLYNHLINSHIPTIRGRARNAGHGEIREKTSMFGGVI